MTEPKVISVATIKFMSDGGMVVSMTSPNGVTAKKLDTVSNLLMKKLMELRANVRRIDTAKQAEARKLLEESEAAERAKKKQSVQPTTE